MGEYPGPAAALMLFIFHSLSCLLCASVSLWLALMEETLVQATALLALSAHALPGPGLHRQRSVRRGDIDRGQQRHERLFHQAARPPARSALRRAPGSHHARR